MLLSKLFLGGDNKGKRKNSLLSVKEENDDTDDDAAPAPARKKASGDASTGKSKGFSAKKMSLADMGLSTLKYETQFDEVDEEGDDDDDGDAPGAFKRPKSAFALAKTDLKSKDWHAEIEGIEAVVRLVKWHRDVIVPEIDPLLNELCNESKNLRSQVTRAALQSFVKLFTHLGRDVENSKNIDAVRVSKFYSNLSFFI